MALRSDIQYGQYSIVTGLVIFFLMGHFRSTKI